MNIVKVAEGCEDISSGALGTVTVATPIIEQVKATKESLEKEDAKPFKKYAFMTGHALLGILEHWKTLQPAVMKTVQGGKEVVQGFKEPGLSLEELLKEKERIDTKQKEACQLLLNPPAPASTPTPGKGKANAVTVSDTAGSVATSE